MLGFFSSLQAHYLLFYFFPSSAHIPLRGRLKSKKSTVSTTSSLEMVLNYQVKTHASNGKSGQSGTRSPPQHGPLQVLVSSVNNQLKSAGIAIDLNDKGKLNGSFSAFFMTCYMFNFENENNVTKQIVAVSIDIMRMSIQ